MKRSFTLNNQYGLHARPASLLAKAVKPFGVEVKVACNGTTVNGTSVLELIMLAAEPGTTLTFTIIGERAPEAMAAVEALFARKFDEQ